MPNFISTFAGVGGFDLGLERAGWTCVGQVEIDPFCLQVLDKHWPDVPKHNDIRTAKEWWLNEEDRPRVDLVCGGFPCQDVSVAGKRAGLGQLSDDARTRTGLFFDAIDFITAVGPEWVLLENVPGLLTSNEGRDFGAVLDALVEGGHPYLEWRVLDSQHFGVPQRRRRVFVVAGTRDPRSSSVLLEPEGVRGDLATSDQEGQDAARAPRQSAASGGGGPVSTLMGGGQRGYRIGAEDACWQILPVLTNPVDTGAARALVGGGAGHDNKHDATRTSYVVSGYPDPASTITKRIDKGINTTLDDGAIITQERSTSEEDHPRKRIIRRSSLGA